MIRSVAGSLGEAIDEALAAWQASDSTTRLWARDASLWSHADESRWLGWLSIVGDQIAQLAVLRALAEDVRQAGFSHALLVGMGGSSLCPEVLRMTFGRVSGAPDLHVIDSTDPGQIAAVASSVDLANTIVIVSSKSGSTLEPNILLEYFYDRVQQRVGSREVGRRFIAITDPGSSLETLATSRHFRHIFHGAPSIGGRYSALSAFGMVPAAIMGIDVARFLDRAAQMVHACSAGVPASANPGVLLGVTLGVLARHGKDKLTILASPGICDLGAWLEQLVAESTGKNGMGIIPVDLETPGMPGQYRDDRMFVYLRLATAPDVYQDVSVAAIEQAGHAVVRISVADEYSLGQEFFRWEIATAVAGALLGINPFDQPDVEASKIATKRLTEAYEAAGSLPPETPILADGPLMFFADDRNAAELKALVGANRSAEAYLRAHFGRAGNGDYAALVAYVPMNTANQTLLQATRHLVRDRRRVATCLGFGPRFLHSTGQVYKGGPNSGVFLQVTCDDVLDLPVPGRRYTFGVVKAAQARGDFQVLAERGRRALRVHLGPDVAAGLTALRDAVAAAVEQA
ncbi:MAG: bifunctional transaldolase/phosoglucose isomerase [Acidobacteria bacterium]|nr:bifunctional transaldolase/phosoglucose isomerase [Acidobacteriota bacterium]